MQDVGGGDAGRVDGTPEGISLREAFASGLRALAEAPVHSAALAIGSVLSVGAVLGPGVPVLVWMLMSLTALTMRPRRGERKPTWFARGWGGLLDLLWGAYYLGVGAVCMLSWDVPLPGADPFGRVDPGLDGLWRAPALLVAAALVMPVRETWLWVVPVFVDGARTPAQALMRSAQLSEAAPRRQARLLGAALSLLPALAAVLSISVGLLVEGRGLVTTLRLLGTGLLLALAFALSRAWLSGAYLALVPDRQKPPRRPPARRAVLWLLPLVLAGAGPLTAAFSVFVPRFPEVGTLPPDVQILAELDHRTQISRYEIPDTDMTVIANPERVALVTADGGGIGDVPLPRKGDILGAKVGKQGSRYWLEILSFNDAPRRLPFDAHGVRLDEQLPVRFAMSCPWPLRIPLFLAILGFGWLWTREIRAVAVPGAEVSGWAARAQTAGMWLLALLSAYVGLVALLR